MNKSKLLSPLKIEYNCHFKHFPY